jgi:hypothetical protein
MGLAHPTAPWMAVTLSFFHAILLAAHIRNLHIRPEETPSMLLPEIFVTTADITAIMNL